MCSNWYWYI
uniref:Uncharacterized protein n=1 Tax=Anguilla anguilla TaxID=7936 RepID=A0A0E9V948_ANGAN